MKTGIIAAAATLCLALSLGASFAAERSSNTDGRSKVEDACDNIPAATEGRAPPYIRYCENQR